MKSALVLNAIMLDDVGSFVDCNCYRKDNNNSSSCSNDSNTDDDTYAFWLMV